jgi:DNA modification methylase
VTRTALAAVIVLDLFSGATTSLAALQRRFELWTVDIDPAYHRLAFTRLSERLTGPGARL